MREYFEDQIKGVLGDRELGYWKIIATQIPTSTDIIKPKYDPDKHARFVDYNFCYNNEFTDTEESHGFKI